MKMGNILEGEDVFKENPVKKLKTEEKIEENHNGSQQPAFNPLEIDLVLLKILSHVEVADLITCRQVDSRWNALASVTLIKDGGAEVVFHNKLEKARNDPLITAKIKEFSTVMKKSKQNVYTKYAFRCVSMQNQGFQKFLQVAGPSIQELTLDVKYDVHLNLKTFNQILTQLAPNLQVLRLSRLSSRVFYGNTWMLPPITDNAQLILPKLKVLVLPFLSDHTRRFFGNIWKKVLDAATNLEEVHISKRDYHQQLHSAPRPQPQEPYLLMKMLQESGRLATLKKLSFFSKLQTADFDILITAANAGMALEELELFQMAGYYTSASVVEEFLGTQSKSLQKLSLGKACGLTCRDCRGGGMAMNLTIPRMECLETLVITMTDGGILLKNYDLSNNLPQLKNLNIHIKGEVPKSVFYVSSATTSFKLSFSKSILNFSNESPCIVSTLSRLHPFVENLQLVNPSEEQFAVLNNAWPDLKSLEVKFHEEDVRHKLGWRNVFPRPEGVAGVLTLLNHSSDKSTEILKRFPVLWELKDLERFSINQKMHVKTVEKTRKPASIAFSINTNELRNHNKQSVGIDKPNIN